MSSKFYIVKYANFFFPVGFGPKYIVAFCSAINCSYTAEMVGVTRDSFPTREEAEIALTKMIEFNPSAGYGIVEGV